MIRHEVVVLWVRGGEERQQEAIRRRFHTRVHTNTTEHSDSRKGKAKGDKR